MSFLVLAQEAFSNADGASERQVDLNQKQSTNKQKDGEQTPHAAKSCKRGSSNRLRSR
jgi:hypothetical protein